MTEQDLTERVLALSEGIDTTPSRDLVDGAYEAVGRTRRRRALWCASMIVALGSIAGWAVAGDDESAEQVASPPAVAPTTALPGPAAGPVGRPGSWPDLSPSPAASCVRVYPDQLTDNANAFDATVTSVSPGPAINNGVDVPIALRLAVHEVFAGPQRTTVTMHTWNFLLPSDPASIIGFRALFAAGPTLDVKGCGYSRPYSDADAAFWRESF